MPLATAALAAAATERRTEGMAYAARAAAACPLGVVGEPSDFLDVVARRLQSLPELSREHGGHGALGERGEHGEGAKEEERGGGEGDGGAAPWRRYLVPPLPRLRALTAESNAGSAPAYSLTEAAAAAGSKAAAAPRGGSGAEATQAASPPPVPNALAHPRAGRCRAAVCVSGQWRSFADPTVRRLFRANLVGGLSGQAWRQPFTGGGSNGGGDSGGKSGGGKRGGANGDGASNSSPNGGFFNEEEDAADCDVDLFFHAKTSDVVPNGRASAFARTHAAPTDEVTFESALPYAATSTSSSPNARIPVFSYFDVYPILDCFHSFSLGHDSRCRGR